MGSVKAIVSRGCVSNSIICWNLSTPYDRSNLLENTLCQVQITQVVLDKNHEGQLSAKVVRQLLWTDGISYELREIYGFGKSTPVPATVDQCMCSNCAKTLRLQSNKCPICQTNYRSILGDQARKF